MILREFLNTANVDWVNLRLWVDEDAYSDGKSGECEVYTDMRDISDWVLDAHIDNWDIGVFVSRDCMLKFVLDILI